MLRDSVSFDIIIQEAENGINYAPFPPPQSNQLVEATHGHVLLPLNKSTQNQVIILTSEVAVPTTQNPFGSTIEPCRNGNIYIYIVALFHL